MEISRINKSGEKQDPVVGQMNPYELSEENILVICFKIFIMCTCYVN